MVRLAVAISAAAVLLLVPAAEAKSRKSCKVQGAATLLQNRAAVIMRRVVHEGGLGETTEIWGCIRAKRRPVLVDSSFSDQYVIANLRTFELRGTFVGVTADAQATDGQCAARAIVFSLMRRMPKHAWREERDPATGTCPYVDRLALGPRGRALLLEGGDTLHKLDATGDHVIDTGAVNRHSLEIVDGEARWRNGDAPRSHPVY